MDMPSSAGGKAQEQEEIDFELTAASNAGTVTVEQICKVEGGKGRVQDVRPMIGGKEGG